MPSYLAWDKNLLRPKALAALGRKGPTVPEGPRVPKGMSNRSPKGPTVPKSQGPPARAPVVPKSQRFPPRVPGSQSPNGPIKDPIKDPKVPGSHGPPSRKAKSPSFRWIFSPVSGFVDVSPLGKILLFKKNHFSPLAFGLIFYGTIVYTIVS